MVRLRTLGTIDLRDARGAALRRVLVQPRRLALLASLALARPAGFTRRDRLLALFWPDGNPERARASLNRAVYFLRQSLGDGVILSRGVEEVGLDADRFWCDATAFEEALDAGDHRQAMSLHGGVLMPAFFVSGAPGFEEWLELERAHYASRASNAAGVLLDAAIALGNDAEAVHWARRNLELAPFDESALRRLLLALDGSGDRAGAVEAFRQFTGNLAAQLGVAPAPETRALLEEIRTRADARAVDARIVTASLRSPRPRAEGAPPAAGRRTGPAMLGLVAAGAGLAALLMTARPTAIDPLRVDVTGFENRTGDPAFDGWTAAAASRVLASLVQAGVVRTVPGAPARVAWRTGPSQEPPVQWGRRTAGRAGTLVSGVCERVAGTIRVRAWITDVRRGSRVWTIPAASGPMTSADAVFERVQARIAGGVAALGNASDASLLPVATSPPIAEAYREFREGLRLEAERQEGEALRHFRLATTIDDEFTWPLVHAALAGTMSVHGRAAWVDSLVHELSSRQGSLGDLERHLVDYLEAIDDGDWPGSYRAIRAAALIAPDQFSYTQAVRAMTLHRPGEAAAALTRPGLDSIYRDDARNYWFVLTLSYHQLGEHGRELDAVRTARRRAPASASLLAQEMRALAALGRTTAVMARLDSLAGLPSDGWLTPGTALMQVASELQAHRQRDAASAVFDHAIGWFRSRPALEAETEVHRFMLGWTLYAAGRLAEAEAVFSRLHREHPDNSDYIGHLGAIAARRGDRSAARRYADRLRGLVVAAPLPGEESTVWRARIAALLGDRSTTVMRLLIQAFGPQGTMELHGTVDFDGMLDHPAFREFVRAKG